MIFYFYRKINLLKNDYNLITQSKTISLYTSFHIHFFFSFSKLTFLQRTSSFCDVDGDVFLSRGGDDDDVDSEKRFSIDDLKSIQSKLKFRLYHSLKIEGKRKFAKSFFIFEKIA